MFKQLKTPILSVDGLRVERGTTAILRQIDWRIKRGQHWVILGPNGCGKTSLLRALTGYLPPSGGRIAVLGRVFGESDWRAIRTRIGLVASALQMSIPFAEPAIETVISGKFARLDLWAKISTTMRRDARRLLSLTGMGTLEEREWGFLSQGERQRVLIARALMARPPLLILDEPCSGLDPIAREHFLGMIERLARTRAGPALVLVTHHVEEITPSFTHALLLREGRRMASGSRRTTLTSENLSATFGTPVRFKNHRGRCTLELPAAARRAQSL